MPSKRDAVWAIDEDGKPCLCYAKPENRGKRNCRHRFHQEPGESAKDFFEKHNLEPVSNTNDTSYEDSIFRKSEISVSPYRMTDEEKTELLKIEHRDDLYKDCDNGAYIEVEEPVWNDMDRNAFSEISGMDPKEINSVLYEESYITLVDSDEYKAGSLVDKETAESLNDQGYLAATGPEAMNAYAAKRGFTATTDVYVLPYYMRAGVPDGEGGEIPSDETALYRHFYLAQNYSSVGRQKAYDALVTAENGTDWGKRRPLADRLKGKQGVWRREITGGTIPYAGRAVAVPDVSIPYDEAKLPPAIAADIFKPSIEKSLKSRGFSPQQISEVLRDAKRRQETVSPITMGLIQDAMDDGNVRVLLNRQPSLHKASIQGLRPRLSNSATVGVNPLIAAGFNLDHDGDTLSCVGINNSDIAREVDEELHPSNFKYTPRKQDELNMKPTKDSLWGIMNVLKRRSS